MHLEDAQDGQPHNMDPMIEVASACHSHSCAIADSLHGSEDVDGEDSSPSSHGSYSDPEFMGPHAQWKCVFWKSLSILLGSSCFCLFPMISACSVHAGQHAQCMHGMVSGQA